MRLSTSTNILIQRPDKSRYPMTKIMDMLADAGYSVLDLNFYDCTSFDYPLVKDDWQSWAEEIKTKAEERKIVFSQAHSDFYNFVEPNLDATQLEKHEKAIARGLQISSMLNIPWVVFHAGTAFSSLDYRKDSFEKNLAYFHPLFEKAEKLGVGIALENLWDLNIAPQRRYTTCLDELLELVEQLEKSHDNVGICWDFEHADIMKQDQISSLERIGSRLKAVHVSEQTSISNDHIYPFGSRFDWKPIMDTLRKIDYRGDFTYEVHGAVRYVPDGFLPKALAYGREIGEYILSL